MGNTSLEKTVMLVSGITSKQEMCIVADGGLVVALQDCAAAVSEGDGRELWSFQSDGQLTSLSSRKCMGLESDGVTSGARAMLVECDAQAKAHASSQWEVLGSGQLKLGHSGSFCLSQRGSGRGRVDVGARAAASASSSISAAHGPGMAVDSDDASYWASKFDDTKKPVMLTLDLGESYRLTDVEISWAFPARAFSVASSTDGKKFVESFATDVNILKAVRVPLRGTARVVRIVMREPHTVHGAFHGHALYGIREVAVHGEQLTTVIEECAVASSSHDARDKYFVVSAQTFDPAVGQRLRSSLPALEVAKTSLAAATTELANIFPELSACSGATAFSASFNSSSEGASWVSESLMKKSVSGAPAATDISEVDALLAEARATVLDARKALS